jgi:hypothetical protein
MLSSDPFFFSLGNKISLIVHDTLCATGFFILSFFFFFLNILFPYIDRSDILLFSLCHKLKVRTTRYTSCGKQLFHIYVRHLIIFLVVSFLFFRKSFLIISYYSYVLVLILFKRNYHELIRNSATIS